MSLREALRATVASCTHLPVQHATFQRSHATGGATDAQQMPASPHGIRALLATADATGTQQGQKTHATNVIAGDTLQTDWRQLDKVYQGHHWTCGACIAAGLGYGIRCGVGASLWSTYRGKG